MTPVRKLIRWVHTRNNRLLFELIEKSGIRNLPNAPLKNRIPNSAEFISLGIIQYMMREKASSSGDVGSFRVPVVLRPLEMFPFIVFDFPENKMFTLT